MTTLKMIREPRLFDVIHFHVISRSAHKHHRQPNRQQQQQHSNNRLPAKRLICHFDEQIIDTYKYILASLAAAGFEMTRIGCPS